MMIYVQVPLVNINVWFLRFYHIVYLLVTCPFKISANQWSGRLCSRIKFLLLQLFNKCDRAPWFVRYLIYWISQKVTFIVGYIICNQFLNWIWYLNHDKYCNKVLSISSTPDLNECQKSIWAMPLKAYNPPFFFFFLRICICYTSLIQLFDSRDWHVGGVQGR